MRWIEASIATRSAEIDELCEKLQTLGVEGISIEDEADFNRFLEKNHKYWDYVDEKLNQKFTGCSRVKFYLPDDAEGNQQLNDIKTALQREINIDYLDDEDWENAWKQYYEPIPIGTKLIIVPEWMQAETNGRSELRLEPGLAFGTGSHETTQMCLRAVEEYAAPGKRVLDLGCGSGILAIAALVLGCSSAVGCDIDAKAPDAASANAALNGIGEDRFKVFAGDVLADEGMRRFLGSGYDIVFANIVADVILPLSGFVRRFMGEQGVLICSGIIEDRADEVEETLRHNGFQILRHLTENEWHAFVCK